MNGIVEKALVLWGMESAEYALIAARENAVYEVRRDGMRVVLRLHRKGYRSDAELWSELEWMAAVERGGVRAPAPIPSASGEMLHTVDGVQVDLLNWLGGAPLASKMRAASGPERAALYRHLGREMAAFHDICDRWTPPQGFTRCAWGRDGLLGDAPLWGRFWDNPMLSAEERGLLATFREKAAADLGEAGAALDYGLIHADLVGENVMVDGDRIQMIDFDDGGYGFRLFDIATALVKRLEDADYPALKTALIEGYQSARQIDLAAFDLFLAIRAATYVGWNIERIEEKGARARNARFVRTARMLAEAYPS